MFFDNNYLDHTFYSRGEEYPGDYLCKRCNCMIYYHKRYTGYYLISQIDYRIEGRLSLSCDEYIIKNIIE